MDFEKQEDLAEEVNMARIQNMKSKATDIEEEILDCLIEDELNFPVEKDVLINKNPDSFIQKNNKTYPAILEFMARILHVDVPIHKELRFGPGGIIVMVGNKYEANKIL